MRVNRSKGCKRDWRKMKLDISKEQCIKLAKLEEGAEVGAGGVKTKLEQARGEWQAKRIKAHNMVSALCKPRGSEGARNWTMSIPAQPNYDPDIVISDALRSAEAYREAAEAIIKQQAQEIKRLEGALKRLEERSILL